MSIDSGSELVRVGELDDGTVTVTLWRPDKKNALSVALRNAVSDALDQLATADDLKVVILAGAGDTFCAGFDLAEFEKDEPGWWDTLWASSDRFHHTVLRFPLPTIAAVHGAALAGGFDLAMLCDIRIASTATRFGHPEHAWSDVLYGPLEMHVGGAAARDVLFTGRDLDAAEALRLGIVSQVVEPDELATAVETTARQIARAPAAALRNTKAKALARAAIRADARTLEM